MSIQHYIRTHSLDCKTASLALQAATRLGDAPQLGLALQAALEELASPDWVTATSGLTTLRRAAVHHADACRPQLCALVLQAEHCDPAVQAASVCINLVRPARLPFLLQEHSRVRIKGGTCGRVQAHNLPAGAQVREEPSELAVQGAHALPPGLCKPPVAQSGARPPKRPGRNLSWLSALRTRTGRGLCSGLPAERGGRAQCSPPPAKRSHTPR